MGAFVIAEAAACHDGSLRKAFQLIDAAAEAGADACKFQWCSSPVELAARRRARSPNVYTLLDFPAEWHERLRQHCGRRRIEYMCTVYLRSDIPVVAPYVLQFKVASYESFDYEFVFAHKPYRKPTVVSTGMHDESQLDWLQQQRRDWGVRLLHCVSAYPAPVSELNLAAIRACHLDGFSDHTGSVWTGAWAVAMGAEIVEVHFRLSRTARTNPDYRHALRPSELARYIGLIRTFEGARGDGVKKPTRAEARMLRYRVGTGVGP